MEAPLPKKSRPRLLGIGLLISRGAVKVPCCTKTSLFSSFREILTVTLGVMGSASTTAAIQ